MTLFSPDQLVKEKSYLFNICSQSSIGITSCAIMFDIIWWSRNQAIFEGVSPDSLKITISTTWTHPQLGQFKVNFDVAKAFRPNRSTCVVVCRNDKEEVIFAYSKLMPSFDPLLGEENATKLALYGCSLFMLCLPHPPI